VEFGWSAWKAEWKSESFLMSGVIFIKYDEPKEVDSYTVQSKKETNSTVY